MDKNFEKDDKLIRDAFDSMGPDAQQKHDIWARIEASADAAEQLRKSPVRVRTASSGRGAAAGRPAGRSVLSRIVAIAAAVVLVMGGITYFQNRPDTPGGLSADIPSLAGYVYAAESRVTDMTPEEVLVQTASPRATEEIYVYAPKIYYMDDTRLIFGNGTGLVIYSFTEGKVEGLIDMQAICSGYYNTDSMETHVMVGGEESPDSLIVYNTKNTDTQQEPWGYYHVFDLSGLKGDGSLLTYTESGNDEETVRHYMELGAAYEEEHYLDAWDNVPYVRTYEQDDVFGSEGGSYSELAYICRSEDGGLAKNVLISRGVSRNTYVLCSTPDAEGTDPVLTELDLGITEELMAQVEELNRLPEYRYSGSDEAIRVICEYMAGEYSDVMYGSGGVCIPTPNIFAQEEKDGELLVFGDFWMENYCRNGNTLISVSGGSWPGCFHLVKSGDTYEVASAEFAQDGELYSDSIKEMTSGFPGLADKYFSQNGVDEQVRRDTITDYVVSNGLGIKYYKDYGWDPVALD